MLKILFNDKHASLLCHNINGGDENMFYKTGTLLSADIGVPRSLAGTDSEHPTGLQDNGRRCSRRGCGNFPVWQSSGHRRRIPESLRPERRPGRSCWSRRCRAPVKFRASWYSFLGSSANKSCHYSEKSIWRNSDKCI
jgi:hypothetical protein